MTIRIIGAILVIIGCGGVGIMITVAHRNQVKTLRQLTMILDFMECELQYRQTPLPELCKLTAGNANGPIMTVFSSLSAELEKQISPDVEQCMKAVLQSVDNLSRPIKESLLLLGQSLGQFDLEGQLKGIEMTKREAQRFLQEDTNDQESRMRCYQTLSICAGAAIVILFI